MRKSKKCYTCNKLLLKFDHKCQTCNKFFHKNCEPTANNTTDLVCTSCLNKNLPFYNLQNLEFFDNFNKKDRLQNCPSFNIQSLLDEMAKNESDENSFLSDTLKSSYYDPHEFKNAKFSKKMFSILHLNIASLSKHFDDLTTLLANLQHEFDVITLTESKIKQNSQILKNFELPGYSYFYTGTESDFGGTLIYIKDQFSPKLLPEFSKSVKGSFESTFVEIKNTNNKRLIIGTIYRHPKACDDFLEQFLNPTLDKLNKNKNKVIITGDFNYDLIKYDMHKNTSDFYDMLSSFSYRPCILQPSRVTSHSNTLIDNIFVNDISCISDGGNITSSISDHFLQFSFCDIFGKIPPKAETKFKRDFRNFKNEEFLEELGNIDWNYVNNEPNIDNAFTVFYNNIDSLLNIMAPLKKQTKRQQGLAQRPWITSGILKSMRIRDALYKKLTKKNLTPQNKILVSEKYKKYRNLIVTLQRRSKQNYFQNYFEKNKCDVKKTWCGIRNILAISKKKITNIDGLKYNGKTLSSNADKAAGLNDFFSNIGKMVEQKIPKTQTKFDQYLTNPNPQNIIHKECTDIEIIEIIRNLQNSKATGPNSIPTNLLKIASPIIVPILTSLINKSLNQGVFPSILKFADVCPIFKKNDPEKCENYRPISLLSNLGKIFEKVMYSRVSDFLENCNILYERQFGFRKGHSTNHALISIVEEIRKNLDNGFFTCGIFVDLEKAFDTVNHGILVKKLEHYGINGPYNNWIKSYLSKRSQCVTLNGEKSKKLTITCGVPQGSVLGPLLFLIYINDMNKALSKSTVHHFADDTNLLSSSKKLNSLRKIMNEELKLLFDWLCANRLSLNVAKTEFLIFRPQKKLNNKIKLRLNDTTIRESTKIKYLGLLLDGNLSWNSHLTELSKKLSCAVGMLHKMKNLCSTETLKSIYYALFHAHLSYGISVWGLSKYTAKICLLQKRAIRAISKADFLAHTGPLFKELKILKLSDQYLVNLASLMWDYDHEENPSSLNILFKKPSHSHNTRFLEQGKLTPYNFHTRKFGTLSLRCDGTRVLNDLKDSSIYTRSVSKTSFIKKFKEQIFGDYL